MSTAMATTQDELRLAVKKRVYRVVVTGGLAYRVDAHLKLRKKIGTFLLCVALGGNLGYCVGPLAVLTGLASDSVYNALWIACTWTMVGGIICAAIVSVATRKVSANLMQYAVTEDSGLGDGNARDNPSAKVVLERKYPIF